MKRWLILRTAAVSLFFAGGVFGGDGSQMPDIALEHLGFVFLFLSVGMLFVIGIQRVNPRSAERWS